MSGRHCPFLNRKDDRCAEHFSVGRMQHAFDHCFSRYASCSTYQEMLEERKLKHDEGDAIVPMTVAGRPLESAPNACINETASANETPRKTRARRPLRAA